MEADQFVEALWACAPDIEQLKATGIPSEVAQRFRDAHLCRKKTEAVRYCDPLLDLISRYDASTVEIGMILLGSSVVKTDRNWQVGEVEADPLVIDKATEEVQVEELYTNGHILSRCAESGGKFLDALLLAASFQRYNRGPGDQDRAYEEAESCALAAGGEVYRRFYLHLFGVYCDV